MKLKNLIYQISILLLIFISIIHLSFSQESEKYPISIQYLNISLRGNGIERINQSQAEEIAVSFFEEKVPPEFKDSVVLEGKFKGSYSYSFGWRRYINGIPVAKEGFVVDVDYSNGNIIFWDMNLGYPTSQIDATPKLTKAMALYTIKKAYTVEPQSSGPYGPHLRIEGKTTVWRVYLPDNSIVTIDGNTGETIRFSHPKEGSKYNQVPTSFNLTQYYIEVYGPYLTVGLAIIGIGSVFILKRKKLLSSKNNRQQQDNDG